MVPRNAKDKILEMAGKYPVLLFTGPRQSGKTTLSKSMFPNHAYYNLENPDNREFAQSDPRGFLAQNTNMIIDEAQNVPELFSYIQQIVDDNNEPGQYILSGSQNFLLLEKITQSLAGRVYIVELLPLSYAELSQHQQVDLSTLLLQGGYPRIYDKQISAKDFFPSYIKTYVERDVRPIANVQNLALFRKFLTLCAHNVGQLFVASNIAKSLGVDMKTVKNWLSILETSYIAFTLNPYHNNLSKRIIKTPKLYFYDVGLASFMLGIESEGELLISKYKGAIFENFVLLEMMKNHYAKGIHRNYSFWRDSNQNEIDLLIEKGKQVACVEMKYSQTVKQEFIKSLHYLDKIKGELELTHYLVNSMDESQKRSNETIVSWRDINQYL
jgi:predicted AAA+ superfamily ATPase